MNINPGDSLQTLVNKCARIGAEVRLNQTKRKIYSVSLLRLSLFIISATACIVYIVQLPQSFLLWIAAVCMMVFIALVKWHDRLYYKKRWAEIELDICKKEDAALEGDYSAFDCGAEYVDASHLYTYDLDVFGPHSLFQSMNRTSTGVGREKLADWLKNHLTDKEQIEQRQQLIDELAGRFGFWFDYRVNGLLATEYGQKILGRGGKKSALQAEGDDWAKWAKSEDVFVNRWYYRALPLLVTAVNMLMFILALTGILSFTVFSTIFVAIAFLSIGFSKRITLLQGVYGRRLQALSLYAPLLKMIEEEKDLNSKEWDKIGKLISVGGVKASQTINKLNKLINALDRRNNVMLTFVLNGLFFWELHQMMRVEKWKQANAAYLPSWLEAVALTDVYCSLAALVHYNPQYIFPEIEENIKGGKSNFIYEAKAVKHPLMNPEVCVSNPIEIKSKPYFLIITGANMAGKSTYLRTVSVNYLLACIGAPVCAESMRITPATLITSLRTSDSLTDNESYFFAELKRLKLIIDMLQEGKQLFVVLDEILRGTNSVDKQKGSLALLKQLLALETNGIIATHDLQLGRLIEYAPDKVRNWCFEADITNNELSFSYKIREGVAQNMNACFLMKKMGIAVAE